MSMKFYHTVLGIRVYHGDVFMQVLFVSTVLYLYFIYLKIISCQY